jgi:hypothetical protein
MTIKVKDWNKFQHFKDRKPPWIKLYRDLLDDLEWHELDPLAAKALVAIWLIASENDGELPEMKKLAFRLRVTEKQAISIVSQLDHWLIQDDINLISDCYQSDSLEIEKETYRKETETKKETEKRERTPRATRLSQDWQPSNSDLDYARELGWTDKQVRDTAQDFSDYWMAKSGQGATKVDWSATWRRWCRNTAPKADATSRADRLMLWAEQKELEKNELKQINTGSFDPFSLLPAIKSG